MEDCYQDDKVIGFLFYELLDEVYLSGYSDPREAYFGFVTCDAEGHIGEKKPRTTPPSTSTTPTPPWPFLS